MTREEFGQRFAAALEAVGLNTYQAAEALGIPQPRIAEYRSGLRVPPTLRLVEIVEQLGLDPRIIFVEWFPRPKPPKNAVRK